MAFTKPLPVFVAICLSLCLSFQYTAKLEGIRDFFFDTVEIILERAKGDPPKSNRTLVDLAGFLNILVKQVDRIVVNPAFQLAPADEVLLKSVVFEIDCEFDKVSLNESKLINVFKLSQDQIEQYKKIMVNTQSVIRNITALISPY